METLETVMIKEAGATLIGQRIAVLNVSSFTPSLEY